MTHGVTMLLLGTSHHVRAAVALMTLRDWFDGPVTLFADAPAREVAHKIADAAGARVVKFNPHKQRRHTGYGNKPRIACLSQYKYTLQLDADTAVVGDIGPDTELWPWNPRELVLTQYANWISTGNIVGSRIKKWRHALPELCAKQLMESHKAVNTGILTFGEDCATARLDWLDFTLLNADSFLSDELAMQLLYPERQHVRMLDERWNWSPMNAVSPDADARIKHFHGSKHVRRRRGLVHWWPLFERALNMDYAELRGWVPAGDKHLGKFLHANPDALTQRLDPTTCRVPAEKK